MSRPPAADYALDQPLPPSVVVGGSARLTRYRQYPVFSWPWLRGRSWLALALVTLGLYVSGALLSLHSDGPQVFGHMPFLAMVAFAAAGLLSLRLVMAIARSGHL